MGVETITTPRHGEYIVPKGARHGYCRSCGRGIAWTKTPAGRPMPLSRASVIERDGVRYALAHFVDCPHGRSWSGHGARATDQLVAAPAAPPTSGAAYVAARRERYRLADGSLPAMWWGIGRRDFR